MKGKIEIEYEWWRVVPSGNGKAPVFERHEQALREGAENLIPEEISDGMIEGSISDWVLNGEEDGEYGVEYAGWWKLNSCFGDD